MEERNRRKTREGIVSSAAMDKTITVVVENRKRHPMYNKIMTSSKKLKAHDEANEAGEGDRVEIMETRPLSATKRWRLVRILEKKK
jgi:small subunit ribosomal protein S17